jgi:hypothetical protein
LHGCQCSLKGILLGAETQAFGRCCLLSTLYDGLTVVPTSDACRACKECSLELLLQCTLSSLLFWAHCSRCAAGSPAPSHLLELLAAGSPAPSHLLELLPYLIDLRFFDATTLKEAHNLSALLGGGVCRNQLKRPAHCCDRLAPCAYSQRAKLCPLLLR